MSTVVETFRSQCELMLRLVEADNVSRADVAEVHEWALAVQAYAKARLEAMDGSRCRAEAGVHVTPHRKCILRHLDASVDRGDR